MSVEKILLFQKYSSSLRQHPERSNAPTNRELFHGGKNDADMFNYQN